MDIKTCPHPGDSCTAHPVIRISGYQPYNVVVPNVNGVCGSANGTTVSSIPTINLCLVGAASAVSGTGPWSWTCAGTGSGTTANCAALKSSGGTGTSTDGGGNGNGNGGGSDGDDDGDINTYIPPGYTFSAGYNCPPTSSLSLTNPATSPVNVNNNTTWTVTPLVTCPTCSKVWTVINNNATTTVSNSSNTLDRIFTTIGMKKVLVSFASTTPGGLVAGLPCMATTTIVQSGGAVREI